MEWGAWYFRIFTYDVYNLYEIRKIESQNKINIFSE